MRLVRRAGPPSTESERLIRFDELAPGSARVRSARVCRPRSFPKLAVRVGPPVVELQRRRVPFLVLSGETADGLPEILRDAPRVPKPSSLEKLVITLQHLDQSRRDDLHRGASVQGSPS